MTTLSDFSKNDIAAVLTGKIKATRRTRSPQLEALHDDARQDEA
jgi:hypothetical protein